MMSRNAQWRVVGDHQVIKTGKEIGKGSESTIFSGRFDEKDVAVKRVLYNEKLNTELEILRSIEHKSVIKYLYTDQDRDFIYIVLELCQYNLVQYVENRPANIHLSPVEVLQQMTDGLDYLHNGQMNATVHRDLKPSNILFCTKGGVSTVRISDFGISRLMPASRTSLTLTTAKGSTGYTAPEVLKLLQNGELEGRSKESRIRRESDIFSLGVIFFYVLSGGKHPHGGDTLTQDKKIRDDDEPNMGSLKEEYSADAERLIMSMIAHKWEGRPTIEQVKAHFLFWDAEKVLTFFQETSDNMQSEKDHQPLISAFNREVDSEAGKDWRDTFQTFTETPEIMELVSKLPKKHCKIQHLIRLIRNWKHHYNDAKTTAEFRKEMGPLPDGLAAFFKTKFPKLLPHTYDVMKKNPEMKVMEDSRFQHFFSISCKSDVKPEVLSEEMSSLPNFASSATESDDEGELNFSGELDEDLLHIEGEEQGESEDVDDQEQPKLVLRKYQEELAQQALSGQNSLIIAPTGCGKTAVAKEIIENHIRSGKSKAILFFVSKTTLARQQYDFFSKHLEEEKMAYLIGEKVVESPVGAIIKEMKLTVLTPKILVNELERRKSFISFHDISMMIFDECHNATKHHPYKEVMDMLLDFQHTNPSHQVQIVGMTASPGVGKGKTRDDVMRNLLTLLANLNIASCPSVVVKHKDELQKHQREIKESFLKVRVENDLFSKKIMKAMDLIEARINAKGVIGNKPGQVRVPPKDRSKQMYESWTVDIINHAKINIQDRMVARSVITFAEHLKMYYHLLYLKKHIPNAMDVTSSMVNFEQGGEEASFLRRIKLELSKASESAPMPPMLRKLLEVLEEEFGSSPDSHCIIFVPRKLIASSLVNCIGKNESLAKLEPVYLTGSNDHSDTGAMTKANQEASLQSFRDGKCKILIATSVAEEGLDIRACNLVIMYNYVTGEVGRIQRAGRGRAEDSRSLLITPIDSAHIEREKMNAVCAAATEFAIYDLNELPQQVLIERIRGIQRSQMRERRRAEGEILVKIEEASKWKILCGDCRSFLTTADNLRQIRNQHKFVVDEEYLGRVKKTTIRKGEQRELAPGVTGVGIFYCKQPECRKYLGMEMQYKTKLYPTLTVKSLVFQNIESDIRQTASQWNKCPFAVERGMFDSDEEEEVEEPVMTVPSKSQGSIVGILSEDLSEDDALECMELYAAGK